MLSILGLAILLIFIGIIVKTAAPPLKIPDVIVNLVFLLLGFVFVYYVLGVLGLLPSNLVIIR